MTASSDAWVARVADSRVKIGTYLRLDLPGGTVYVSDFAPSFNVSGDALGPLGESPWYQVALEWPTIEPRLVADDAFPEAREVEVSLSNGVQPDGTRIGDLVDIDGLEGSAFALRTWVRDATTGAEPIVSHLSGVVLECVEHSAAVVRLRLADRMAALDRELSHLVSDDYPQAPASVASKIQPLVYGIVPGFPVVPIDVGRVNRLSATLIAGATSLTLEREIAAWPSSGVIQADAELIAYASKDDATKTLSGLTRAQYGTADSPHAEGAVVAERPASYRFLVADRDPGPVADVDRVMVGTRELDSSLWSFDDSTNILTITPAEETGHRTISRIGEIMQGTVNPMWTRSAGGTTPPPGLPNVGLSRRPVHHATHAMLWPYKAAWIFDAADISSAPGPRIEAKVNTAISLPSTDFADYVPPDAILRKTGVKFYVEIEPVFDLAYTRSGTLYGYRPRPPALYAVKVEAGGFERIVYLGAGDEVNMPRELSDFQSPQVLEFDFSDDLGVDGVPYSLTITPLGDDGNDGARAGWLRGVWQEVLGAVPYTVVEGVTRGSWQNIGTGSIFTGGSAASPGFDDDDEWTDRALVTFPRTFDQGAVALQVGINMRGGFGYEGAAYVRITTDAGDVIHVTGRGVEGGSLPSHTYQEESGGFPITILAAPTPASLTLEAFSLTSGPGIEAPSGGSSTEYGGTQTPEILVKAAMAAGYAASSDVYQLLDLRDGVESTWLLAYGEYPRADVQGYADVGGLALPILSAGEPIRNPIQAAEHWLVNVAGESTGDMGSNLSLRTTYQGLSYRIDGAITEAEDVRAPLWRMMRQCRLRLAWSSLDGAWRLSRRRSAADLLADLMTAPEIGAADMPTLPRVTPPARRDLLDVVRVRYLRNWGGDGDDFEAVASSGSGTQADDARFVADFLRVPAAAADLAAHEAEWATARTRRLVVAVTPEHFDLHAGDVVALSLPIGGSGDYLAGADASGYEVESEPGFQLPHGTRGQPPMALLMLREIPV